MKRSNFCKYCEKNKDISEFNAKNKSRCKPCIKEYSKGYSKKYYEVHKESLKTQIKEYRDNNLEKARAVSRQYYTNNRASILIANKKYREINRHKVNEYFVNRRQRDLSFRLACNMRVRLSEAVSGKNKSASAIKDLGCSLDELRLHLESQFKPGMTWENYGEWHIDHIRPLVSFDLSNSKQAKTACHYTNLQPLWAEENFSKGGKR